MIEQIPTVVTAAWLAERMANPGWLSKFRIIDATWNEPVYKRDFKLEHFNQRIRGAKYFDVDECWDHNHPVQYMLPTLEQFEESISKLGVGNEHHVIIYENNPAEGMFTGPRLWLEFKVFGHDKVSVLDGGLPKWIADGFATASGKCSTDEILPESRRFKAHYRPEFVAGFEMMMKNLDADEPALLIDTRPVARFLGIEPEPIPGVPSGHIPQAINVDFTEFFKSEQSFKVLNSSVVVERLLTDKGIDLRKAMVSSCLVGLTASIASLVIFHFFGKICKVYDGSWLEWHVAAPVDKQIRLLQKTNVRLEGPTDRP